MKTFVIGSDNNVTVFSTAAQARTFTPDADRFSSEDDLARLAAKWPSSRVVEMWNSIPGVPPVKKFMDRKTGIHRIWSAVQQLEPAPADDVEEDVAVTPKFSNPVVPEAKGESKKDMIVGLLMRTEGATLEALMSATGWQAHSVRGFISGTLMKKFKLSVNSVKKDGQRVYSMVP